MPKLKHLLRYLIGTKMCVLRLRPSYQLSDGNCSLDVNVYVDSDWAGCSKTRKSTSGSTVNVLGCNMVGAARTQGTLALSSMRLVKECRKLCSFGQCCLKPDWRRKSV